MGLCFFINGLANNSIIPIAHKISLVYDLPSAYLNAPIAASFLVYSISNFPANFIIDTKGLRFSFLIGSGLYAIGILLFTLINKGYFFVLIGAILVAIGQPFIVNCPAKVATFWFLSKNVTFRLNLENFCDINHDRNQSGEHRNKLYAPDYLCWRRKSRKWRERLNILSVCSLFSSSNYHICVGIFVYESPTIRSPISGSISKKVESQRKHPDAQKRQEFMEIFLCIRPCLWNCSRFRSVSKSSFQTLWIYWHSNRDMCHHNVSDGGSRVNSFFYLS